MNDRSPLLLAAAVLTLVAGGAVAFTMTRSDARPPAAVGAGPDLPAGSAPLSADPSGLTYRRATGPDRTEAVRADGTRVAVMTDGARTVHLTGAQRTFAEPKYTKAKVSNDIYVRLAPQEWKAGAEKEKWFTGWLPKAMADKSPDAIGIAMEYIDGAPAKKNAEGQQIGGDAEFGPLSDIDPDGRAENSDFYDYLGVAWNFSDKQEQPSQTHFRSLDCSGFLRMVYGYRMGYPVRGTNNGGPGLPRQAFAMAGVGPGVQLMPNTGKRATAMDRLMPGDMLFFNAGSVQGANIEHSGMYLGVDDRGHHRFISSRSQANGPTMGDLAGESVLDGTGYWAIRWRTARRV
jgi:cell wall-associated NlpC family hydrolase